MCLHYLCGRPAVRPTSHHTIPYPQPASEAELWEDIKQEQEERERVKGQGGQDNGEGQAAAQVRLCSVGFLSFLPSFCMVRTDPPWMDPPTYVLRQALQKQLDYYPSGLTPPTRHIVRRRFAETRMHGPYPVCECVYV